MLRLRPLFMVTALATASGCGLVDPPAPKPLIDDFRVTMTLVSNSCGYAGLPLQTVTQLDGRLRGYAGEAATWKWTGTSSESSGSSTADGHYTFVQTTTSELAAADVTLNYPGCVVTQRTELSFAIVPVPTEPADAGSGDAGADAGADAGSDAGTPYALSGQMRVDVTPVAGGDCTPLLGANGGTWQALPCQGIVTLAGVPAP